MNHSSLELPEEDILFEFFVSAPQQLANLQEKQKSLKKIFPALSLNLSDDGPLLRLLLANQKCLFIGGSGCGKSYLINSLLEYNFKDNKYRPLEGEKIMESLEPPKQFQFGIYLSSIFFLKKKGYNTI